ARVVLELMGQQVTAEITVSEAKPERRLALSASVGGVGVVATLDLEPHAGGTQITLSSEVRAENIFMAPLERMVTDTAERDLDASLARVAAALAAPQASPRPRGGGERAPGGGASPGRGGPCCRRQRCRCCRS